MSDVKAMLIGGQWRPGSQATENVNPSDTNDVIGLYATGNSGDVNSATSAAQDALLGWSKSTPQMRHDILARAAAEISERRLEIGQLLAREEGKVLPEAIGETVRAANIFAYFAGEALRQRGEKVDLVRPGIEIDVTREPVGVVGLITPWNFPIAIPAWKTAPALCFGNTVVLKPAELVPGCAWMLADILKRAGLPDGVFNLVMGEGRVVGHAMLEDPRIDAISFTGSQTTGARVAEACSRHMRKVQVEMGGKNPLIVVDDADLDLAVDCAIDGAFFSTGQRCTASSRLIVTEGIHSRFVETMLERMRHLKVDHALTHGTDIGPVVDQLQLDQDRRYIEIARQEGGQIRFGGEAVQRDTPGFYLTPALVMDTDNAMTINREEVFGPVASVIRVRDYEEALSVANDTPFGLCAGICTTSLKYSNHFRRHAQAGMTMVNLPTAGVDYHVPFGGMKGSSLGQREQGSHAVAFFTNVKTSYCRP